MLLLLEQLMNGLQYGVMLFLLAAGLTLVFGIMGVINLAHGSLFMIGAYAAAAVAGHTGSFALAALAALAARAAAEAEMAEAERHRRDLAMVESYATENDLRRAYGERITLVEEALKTSGLSITNLRQSLLSLLRQAAERELLGQPVGKALVDGIQAQHGDLVRQQAIMERQLADRASLGSDLDGALERYRSMKGLDAPG